MENRYLKKIGSISTSLASRHGHMAIGALVGGSAGAYQSNRNAKDNPKKTRIIKTIAGGVLGGILGTAVGHDIHVFKSNRRHHTNWTSGKKGYHNSSGEFIHETAPVDSHLKSFGLNSKSYKTKAEYTKHFKTELHKNHPDKGGSTKKFQNLSAARDSVHKSPWFNKLAHLILKKHGIRI